MDIRMRTILIYAFRKNWIAQFQNQTQPAVQPTPHGKPALGETCRSLYLPLGSSYVQHTYSTEIIRCAYNVIQRLEARPAGSHCGEELRAPPIAGIRLGSAMTWRHLSTRGGAARWKLTLITWKSNELLSGSFSAISTPIFASKYSLEWRKILEKNHILIT